ncbi:hypothetical protein CEXT_660841 [Caerostris extrusa]|uniref:Uncharacterized protein n=1 Tax=Caerostris extrusa TaxID=172846 RepID=A0AAV4Y2L1_CAEEX|nr:hypothetical protein CEXT_660841 [Caerostris extrusa]
MLPSSASKSSVETKILPEAKFRQASWGNVTYKRIITQIVPAGYERFLNAYRTFITNVERQSMPVFDPAAENPDFGDPSSTMTDITRGEGCGFRSSLSKQEREYLAILSLTIIIPEWCFSIHISS